MLLERMGAETGEAMAQELGLGNSKLTFAQANRQAMAHGTAPGCLRDAEYEKLSQS